MLEKTNVNVLLIEDDETSIILTQRMLESSSSVNFKIHTATSLKKGIENLKECLENKMKIYDVILLDLILPNGEGLNVFKSVKNVCSNVPIIIVSGHEDKAIECMKHGAQDYLIKPLLNSDILIRSIIYSIERFKLDRKYSRLVESTNAVIYELNFITNKFVYVNNVMCKELGYTEDELLQMSPWDILTKESALKWKNRLKKINKGDEINPVEEYEVITKKGEYKWVLITAEYKYEGVNVVGANVIAIDITDRKGQENKIKKVEREMEEALNKKLDLWRLEVKESFDNINRLNDII